MIRAERDIVPELADDGEDRGNVPDPGTDSGSGFT